MKIHHGTGVKEVLWAMHEGGDSLLCEDLCKLPLPILSGPWYNVSMDFITYMLE